MSKKSRPRPEPSSLGLPRLGVETHAHLDAAEFQGEVENLLVRAAEAGVTRLGNVFLGSDKYLAGRAMFDHHPGVFFLLGTHPHEASAFTPAEAEAMRRAFAADPRLKAVGETGLDYYYDLSPREVQRRVFREQLALTRELDKPVVIHSRDALDDTLAILDQAGCAGHPVLWHCFGGGPDMARALLDRGWMLSIPGVVTYPKATDLREAVAMIPLDRLVLETDCPYLAPDPYRGKRNEPAYLAFTAACVAEIKGLPTAELWRICADNAIRFFGLDRE